MDIAEYGMSPSVDPLMKQLDEYGLMKHALELEAYGLTVVPKEKLGVSDDFGARLRDAILRTCEKRNGVKVDDYLTAEIDPKETSKNSWYLLQEDDVFVEAATNPATKKARRVLFGGPWKITESSSGAL